LQPMQGSNHAPYMELWKEQAHFAFLLR